MRKDFSWFCNSGRHPAGPAVHAGRAGIVRFAFCKTCRGITQQTVEHSPGPLPVRNPQAAGRRGLCQV